MVKQIFISVIHPIYLTVSVLLSVYSINAFIMTLLFWLNRLRKKKDPPPSVAEDVECDWPLVAVQLPFYNEKEIALRIIDQVVKLDYPADRLHIQVLDDSTDETCEMVARQVAYYQSKNVWITHHHRTDRREFKAGALRDGMSQTPANLFAVFDADFLPPADWLKRTVKPLTQPGNDHVGFVQTRWTHLNDRYSFLTHAQALLLDGHFGVEQTVCTSYGFFNYLNGTGFILRRACVEESGNWNGTTLVEDLDLSLRIQLGGWKAIFLPEISAPAELPALFTGFKRQQFRWAKGSMQTIRRLTGVLLKAPLPFKVKFEALLHLCSHLIHPLVVLLLLLALPLYTWSNDWLVKIPINSLGVIGLGMPFYFITAHFTIYPSSRWKDILIRIPALSLVQVGIAVNNTLGILEGLGKGPVVFERTPKMGLLENQRLDYKKVKGTLRISKGIWLEVLFAIYALFATIVTLRSENYIAAYFFAVYVLGLSWIAASELIENIITTRNQQN